MKNGPLIFLGGLIAMIGCWCGLVVAPVLGLGALGQHVDGNTGVIYPLDRSGTAKQGAEIYRSLGCGECHTRFATQDSLLFGARLVEIHTNRTAVLEALLRVRTDWDSKTASDRMADDLPLQVVERVSVFAAERAVELLSKTESKAELTIHNSGDDLRRGWGERHSVSRDYIFDQRVLLGSRRIGPDLANIGTRAPKDHVGPWAFVSNATNVVDRLRERQAWHLRRLYNPTISVAGAHCPSYKFLFEQQSRAAATPAQVIGLPEKYAPPDGKIVVAKSAAVALVDWLLSQQADTSLPEAPIQKKDSARVVKEEIQVSGTEPSK